MDQVEILSKLADVYRTIFHDPAIVLTPETVAKDIAGYDSVVHVTLIIEVENVFGVKFRMREIDKLKNVGDLAQLVGSKLAA